MAARSFAYHAHGTANGDKFCCYPWLVCHDIKSAMHCSLRLAPTMINHLTSIYVSVSGRSQTLLCCIFWLCWQVQSAIEFSFRVAPLKRHRCKNTWHVYAVCMSPTLNDASTSCIALFANSNPSCICCLMMSHLGCLGRATEVNSPLLYIRQHSLLSDGCCFVYRGNTRLSGHWSRLPVSVFWQRYSTCSLNSKVYSSEHDPPP